jgi:hypothetical protein
MAIKPLGAVGEGVEALGVNRIEIAGWDGVGRGGMRNS